VPKLLPPITWRPNWIKRRNLSSAKPACALDSCAGPRSLWQRLRQRPSGTVLQGAFYCRHQCLETALLGQLSRLRAMSPPQPAPNRIPLGLLMVARGKLTYVEVRAALEAQRRARYGKIGEWIEKLGFASEQEVTSALALQWGCPLATSFDPSNIDSPGNIPLTILEAFQMLPLHYLASTNTLRIAFGERVDHAALYAIEKILDCRTQPCVAGRKSIAGQLDAMRQLPRPRDVEFGGMNDLAEMARIASSYTARLSPEQVRLSRLGRFIWLRLDARPRAVSRSLPTNLVFRLSAEAPRAFPFTLHEPFASAPPNP
jgi:hypothetical protein